MSYELIDLEESEYEIYDFKHEIRLGDLGYYFVLCENKPYLKVEVNLKKLFDDWIF